MGPSNKRLTNADYIRERRIKYERKQLDRILQRMFEYGYYNDSPLWYWLAVRDTLLKANKIIIYNPNIVTCDNDNNNEFEMKNINEQLDDELKYQPVITVCWQLLDIFYDKLDDDNLENTKIGLLLELDKSFSKYNDEYLKTT